MDAPTRSYGGISAEKRRSTRRAALLDAALDLVAEGGVNNVTKSAVCARSGLNDRYFYEHFTDRDALLATLISENTERGVKTVVAAMADAGDSITAQLHAVADASLAFLTSDARLKALLVGPHNEVSQRARVSAQHSMATVMAMVVRSFGDPAASDGVEIEMMAYAVVSGVTELMAAWLRGEFQATQEQVRDLISSMLIASTTLPLGLAVPQDS
jgi:AcrR family transcriptional regulator